MLNSNFRIVYSDISFIRITNSNERDDWNIKFNVNCANKTYSQKRQSVL